MWLDKQFFSNSSAGFQPYSQEAKPLRVGVLGTGKIGTDLLIKVMRSQHLEPVMFSGRNLQSEGMQYAAGLGVPVSDQGVRIFGDEKHRCDLVFDATSAAHHFEHSLIFEELGILAVDMTPSQIGESIVPAISLDEIQRSTNISMISCGGQSSIPIAYALAQCNMGIQRLEVDSIVSPESVGPGTWANINEYYRNTAHGLRKYTSVEDITVDLRANEEHRKSKMITTVTVVTSSAPDEQVELQLHKMVTAVRKYVPGYNIESVTKTHDGVSVKISVEGLGDFLPTYAGNLDIINCAAIAVAERFALMNQTESVNQISQFF